MATRSTITAKTSSGQFKTIYCHWDGYTTHNGKILVEHYSEQDKVDALMNLGDLSVLAKSPYDPPAEHTFDNKVEGYCVSYVRDKGDIEREAAVGSNAHEAIYNHRYGGQEYDYIWEGFQWFVNGKSVSEVFST